eukprot:145219-Pelagomonas_calceolata.AAC.12
MDAYVSALSQNQEVESSRGMQSHARHALQAMNPLLWGFLKVFRHFYRTLVDPLPSHNLEACSGQEVCRTA